MIGHDNTFNDTEYNSTNHQLLIMYLQPMYLKGFHKKGVFPLETIQTHKVDLSTCNMIYYPQVILT